MARIDWAAVCDRAFFDREDRLCMVGISRRFTVAHLPLVIGQVTLVARLTDVQPADEIEILIAVVTPSGLRAAPAGAHGVAIEMSGGYVLATLRDIPLTEEGMYGFQVSLAGQRPVSVDIPVLTVPQSGIANVH